MEDCDEEDFLNGILEDLGTENWEDNPQKHRFFPLEGGERLRLWHHHKQDDENKAVFNDNEKFLVVGSIALIVLVLGALLLAAIGVIK